jgi:hypothetical protein
MFNPEARDPSPLIFPLWVHGRGPRHRRCQGGGGQDGACGREPLLDWMSWSWSHGSRCGAITSVRRPLPHSPGRRGTRCRSRRRGTRRSMEKIAAAGLDEVGKFSCGKNHFGEDSASPPRRWSWSRGSPRCGAITAVRSPLPHSSPGPRISGSRCGQIASRGAYSPILREYMCTFSILGCCRMGVVEYAVLLGFACSTGDEQLWGLSHFRSASIISVSND